MIAAGWVVLTLCCAACLVLGAGAGVVGTVAVTAWLVRKGARLAARLAAG